MKLSSNALVKAIADKLKTLWPERIVYVDEISQGSDGNFFINVTEADYEKKLDRRRERSFAFDICFFLKSNNNQEYREWAEAMLREFETVELDGVLLRCSNMRTEIFDRIGHVLFTVRVSARLLPESGELMETLMQKGDD